MEILTFEEQGSMHRRFGVCSQDAFRTGNGHGWQFCVVCDGVSLRPDGSFSQSEIAAQYCAQKAVSLLESLWPEEIDEKRAHTLMDTVFTETLEGLRSALEEKDIPFFDCQTTMLACAAKNGTAHCGLAGDGGMILEYGSGEIGLLVTSVKTSSQVFPIGIPQAWRYASAGSPDNPLHGLLCATDGILDALVGLDAQQALQINERAIQEIFSCPGQKDAEKEFSRICRELPGEDDKTAVLLSASDAVCVKDGSSEDTGKTAENPAAENSEKENKETKKNKMEYAQLNTGAKMPMVGFGVYKIKDPAECEKAVLEALKAGYRLIDTASVYGNEEAVGKAIAASGIPRDEIFLTTKIWIQDFGFENCRKAIDRALEKLQTSYVDLMLIHHPQMDCIGAYRALEEAYRQKKCLAIGVSNFYPYRLLDFIYSTSVVPAVNQVELSPYFAQPDAIAFMKEQIITPQAWAPLAQNRFGLLEEPVLKELAEKYGKSPAQIALRWNVQRGVAVVVKSGNPQRMRENLDLFDFELLPEEMDAISALSLSKSRIEDPFDLDFVRAHDTRKIHD